jgi:hypothetical protein
MMSTLNAMGVVYGDIGTSPLYTLKSLFESGPPEPDQVKGFFLKNHYLPKSPHQERYVWFYTHSLGLSAVSI